MGKLRELFLKSDTEESFADVEGYPRRIPSKDNIERSYGRNSVTTKFSFEGKELEHAKFLSDYDIQSGSICICQMQIYLYFLSKSGFLLDVEPSFTIEEMKIMTYSKEPEFDMFHQCIFLDGNNLDDNLIILQCDVVDGSNIFVVVRDGLAKPKYGCIQIYVK